MLGARTGVRRESKGASVTTNFTLPPCRSDEDFDAFSDWLLKHQREVRLASAEAELDHRVTRSAKGSGPFHLDDLGFACGVRR